MSPGLGIWLLSISGLLLFVLGSVLAIRHHWFLAGLCGAATFFTAMCILAVYNTHYR